LYRGTRGRSSRLFFSLLDSLEHVTRLGNPRQVDLRLVLDALTAPRVASAAGPAALKVRAHTLCFVKLKRTGMRLLLGNAHVIEHIENSSALDFQLSR